MKLTVEVVVHSLEPRPCPIALVVSFLQKVGMIHTTGSRTSFPPSNIKPVGLQVRFVKPTLAAHASRDSSVSDTSVSSGETAIPLLNCWTAVRL